MGFFSASSVLGSRPGSVGVGVAGCPGCAWVWSVRVWSAPVSLAVALPVGVSAGSASSVAALVACSVGVRSVSVRWFRGRCFLRVRGSSLALRSVAAVWGGRG